MGLSAKKRQRLLELASEAQEILGSSRREDGVPLTFAELEEECIEAGDFMTATMLQARVVEKEPATAQPCCPTCDQAGELLADDEARVLQTDRGEIGWTESTFYCRRCRRSFFPSLG